MGPMEYQTTAVTCLRCLKRPKGNQVYEYVQMYSFPWHMCMVILFVVILLFFHCLLVLQLHWVKPIDYICGLEFNRYVCFSFCGNRTTFGWDIGNSIFDLKNSRSRSWPRSNLMVTFEALEFNPYVCFPFGGNRTILAEILQILYLTLKIQGQGHGQDRTRWSHLSPRVQSISLNVDSWQSDHFWLRYSKFHIWPWKI